MVADFCVTIGACVDLLGKSGSNVIMNCAGAGSNLEWKLSNSLLIGKGRTGVQRKGIIKLELTEFNFILAVIIVKSSHYKHLTWISKQRGQNVNLLVCGCVMV